MRLPLRAAKDLAQQKNVQANMAGHADSLLPNMQYFLMRYKGVKKVTGSLQTKAKLEDEYEGLENDIQVAYDFDPMMLANKEADEKEQHANFCSFLDERALTIDAWDGDNLMHFGQCKIPLYFLMRQGEALRATGQEVDLVESENANVVAKLQLVMSNQGRLLKQGHGGAMPLRNRQDDREGAHNSRIEHSHPITMSEIQETLNDKLLIGKTDAHLTLNEEERKRRRVERIKQMELQTNFDSTLFKNASSSDWEKLEQLKQIQLLRQVKKQEIIAKLSANSEIAEQKVINVVSGEPCLFELDVVNTSDKR